MSKRRKTGVIVSKSSRAFLGNRNVVLISGTTGGDAKQGLIYADVATAGAETGNCYLAIDASGTGTIIND